MAASKLLGQIFRVSSTSTTIGVAPASRIASTVATKVKDWVMTSSPRPTPKAFRPAFKAAVPEETA